MGPLEVLMLLTLEGTVGGRRSLDPGMRSSFFLINSGISRYIKTLLVQNINFQKKTKFISFSNTYDVFTEQINVFSEIFLRFFLEFAGCSMYRKEFRIYYRNHINW